MMVLRLECGARGMGRKIDGAGGFEEVELGQVVIEKEADADHPARALAFDMRQDEAQRPDEMRRLAHEDLALAQGIAHQPHIEGLEITQPAMDELG